MIIIPMPMPILLPMGGGPAHALREVGPLLLGLLVLLAAVLVAIFGLMLSTREGRWAALIIIVGLPTVLAATYGVGKLLIFAFPGLAL